MSLRPGAVPPLGMEHYSDSDEEMPCYEDPGSGQATREDTQIDSQPPFSATSTEGFLGHSEKKLFDVAIETHHAAIFQIRHKATQDVGTGCLIGGNLLITSNHVVPSADDVDQYEARIWDVEVISAM